MEITGIFINGFEILGFQVRTKKGELKRLSYQKVIELARSKKIKGVGVQTIRGNDYLTGIDYSTLAHLPFRFSTGEIKERKDNGNYLVSTDGRPTELSEREMWCNGAAGVIEGTSAGLIAVNRNNEVKVFKVYRVQTQAV